MAKDPVCGVDVDERFAPMHIEYQQKVHFFCSPACKEVFDRNPNHFVEQPVAQASRPRKTAA